MTVISVYPHFSSINDAANPTGPAPMITADFFWIADTGAILLCPMTVTGDVVEDMILVILARNKNAAMNALGTLTVIEIILSTIRRCTTMHCSNLHCAGSVGIEMDGETVVYGGNLHSVTMPR